MKNKLLLQHSNSHLILEEKKSNILIVCDDITKITAFKKSFNEQNYNIITATDGFEAIKNYVKYSPDLVILQNTLPGISGYETSKKIKLLDSNAKFILMSTREFPVRISRHDRKNIPILIEPITLNDFWDIVDSKIKLDNLKQQIQNKTVSVLLDDDLYEKIRLLQSEKIKNDKISCSFSDVVNQILKVNFNI